MSNSDVSDSKESGEEFEDEDIEMMSGSDDGDDDDDDENLEMSDLTDSENEPSIYKEKSKTISNNNDKSNSMSKDTNDSSCQSTDNDSEPNDDDDDNNDNDDNDDDDITESGKPDVWEDIYGRKRDKEGKVIKVNAKDLTSHVPDFLNPYFVCPSLGELSLAKAYEYIPFGDWILNLNITSNILKRIKVQP